MSDPISIPYTFTTPDDFGAELVKAHADDAAYDLRAAERVPFYPGDTLLVKTGLRLAIPKGYAGLVLSRSGLAAKQGIWVANGPGLIDPGYDGEIGVILHRSINNDDLFMCAEHGGDTRSSYVVEPGDRIAQLLIIRTADAELSFYPPIRFTDFEEPIGRGWGGFGSTGK